MLRKWLRSPLVTAALFVVAAGLILFGGIRGVQAAPRIQSTWFGAEVELDDIDVTLIEQSGKEESPRPVHGDDALLSAKDEKEKLLLLGDDSEFTVGKKYVEKLAVRNTVNTNNNAGGADGNAGDQLIKEFVRVTVYKYWTTKDADGNYVKAPQLDPSKIEIGWDTSSGWSIDDRSTTAERTVLYYADILEKGKDTNAFTKSIRVDSSVLDDAAYKDARFQIEAVVDAVQTHNGKDAMMSAWGNNDMITVGADADE